MTKRDTPGEKIVRLQLKRADDMMYFIQDGDIWATPRKKRGQPAGKAARVAETGIELDYDRYIYYLDEDGDLARKVRAGANAKARAASKQNSAQPLIAFSWGYRGWGPYTTELVTLFDKVEKARGFAPPLFVDIRLKRVVRAPGFREKAFEQLMGPDRHIWMPELGNLAVADSSLSMTIAKPEAAKDLLDKIAEADSNQRRVIFFCSCDSPRGRPGCHRGAVTRLLLAAARDRGVQLAIQEWPGTEPQLLDVVVNKDDFATLCAQARTNDSLTSIALPAGMSLEEAGALAHFTVLRCTYEGDHVWAIAGPAVFTARGWRLPVYQAYGPGENGKALLRVQVADFKEFELSRFATRLPSR